MRIRAALDELHHAHLLVYLYGNQFPKAKPADFVIDTGCSITTILSDYATLLGINCSNLCQSGKGTNTANGTVIPYIMPNVGLIYESNWGFLNLKHGFRGTIMDEIYCQAPTPQNQLTTQKISNACCLLGMDFLYQFKSWKYTRVSSPTNLVTQQTKSNRPL